MASGFSSKHLGKEIDNEISYVKEELRDIIKRHENNIEDISNELNDVSTKIPTKVSELENDKGYMLSTDLVGQTIIEEKINTEIADRENGDKELADDLTETDTALRALIEEERLSRKSDIAVLKNSKVNTENVLTKDNTTAYSPTNNYHPATKKYVDDIAINSGAGDMLRSVYDTDGDGVVDNAMALNGLPASDYVTQSQLDNVDSANKVDKVEGYGLISLYDNIIEDTLYGTDLTVIGEDGNKTYAFIPRLLSDMVDDVGYATNEKVDDTNEKINEIYDILTYTAPALTEVSPDGTMIGSDGWTGTGFMCTAENTKYAIKSSDMSNRIVGFNRFCLRFADTSGNKWKNWSPWLDIDGVAYEFFYSPARKLYEALIPATTKTAEEIVSSIRWERAEPDVIRYGKLSSMMGSYVTTSTGSDGSTISTTEYYPILNDEMTIRDCSGEYNYYDAQFLFLAFMGSVEFDSSIDINLISKVWLRADLNCDGRCNNNDMTQIPKKIQTSTVFTVETIDNFA